LVAIAVILVCMGMFVTFAPVGAPPIWIIAYLLAYLVGANLCLLLAMRFFRCPHCGARFGWRTFTRDGWSQPWAYWDCWHCGRDLGAKSN
jgi:hypothetical protein